MIKSSKYFLLIQNDYFKNVMTKDISQGCFTFLLFEESCRGLNDKDAYVAASYLKEISFYIKSTYRFDIRYLKGRTTLVSK